MVRMDMPAMRAVVTGGAGFIGSHLVAGLLQEGYEVTVFDDFSTGRTANLAGVVAEVQVIEGDVRDQSALVGALRGATVVFHEAACASVSRSIEDPLFVHDVNATGTLAVLMAARMCDVPRFVYASSTAAYGEVDSLPVSEDAPTRPISPYGASKLAGENYCIAFAHAFGLPTIGLRYFNVFGPAQDPESQYAPVIPKFTMLLLRGEPLTIFGDGEQTRDFVYVSDVVRANILAARAPAEACGGVFNVASGVGRSINDVAAALELAVGQGRGVEHRDAPPGDIRHNVGDVSSAEKVLGFRAATHFVDGIRETVEWFRHQGG
jgi:UDP-glucose 4-epimerase